MLSSVWKALYSGIAFKMNLNIKELWKGIKKICLINTHVLVEKETSNKTEWLT